MNRTRVAVVVALTVGASAASAAPVREVLGHPNFAAMPPVPSLINSHTVYLNKCASGCTLHTGNTDARTSTSDIASGQLSRFTGTSTQWTDIKNCVTAIMQPFNITVTDTDPGANVDRFEVMVAGNACDILPGSICNGIEGVADALCQSPGQCFAPYLPNGLVFAFSTTEQNDVNLICGTIAQEVAHDWTLDHVIESTDPMTYNNYSTPLNYQNGARCGSDCLYQCPSGSGSCNALGITCSGSGGSATHTCMSTGQSTQNEVDIINGLFGPAGAAPPTLKITSPTDGSAEQPGFPIQVSCTSPDGIIEVDLSVDGVATATLTAAPFNFVAPSTLKDGTHMISVLCGTTKQAVATATANIIIGEKCSKDSDCTESGFICYEGACIAGPNAPGGLGTTCTTNGMCASGSCTSDGTSSYCVVPCDLNNDQCPSGTGCLADGGGGICWPGATHGSSGGGGCNTGGNGALVVVLGLGFLVLGRRRRA